MSAVLSCEHEVDTADCALENMPLNSDLPSDTLKARADELLASYRVSHSVADLEAAIGIYEDALRLRPLGHEDRAVALNDLGDALFNLCCYHQADESRSNRCIELLREGLLLRPLGHPRRDQSLHCLARALDSVIYQQLGSLDILVECATLNREALRLRPIGHSERANSMNNLANNLSRIFKHTGDTDSLAEIVTMRREVMRMQPAGHPMRLSSLGNLGIALGDCFEHLGGSDIVAQVISVYREAVRICPIGHPGRPWVLDNLAGGLSLRSTYEGHSIPLLEAISLERQALQLLSGSHPQRARIMCNLADVLLASFHFSGDGSILAEALTLFREVVTVRRRGFLHDYDRTLEDLAAALAAKFDTDGDMGALSEAADLYREALLLRPMGDPRRFASFEGLAKVLWKMHSPSWPEVLSCYQEALQTCPVGYPARSRLLSGISRCFLDLRSPSFSISEGVSYLSKAYADTFSHIGVRLKSALLDLDYLEAAYGALTKEDHMRSEEDAQQVLNLYAQVIGLLPLAAHFGLDHSARLQALTGCDEVARNAAARAARLGCVTQAVEMLEQGRGVFWTQTLHLRTTAFDGIPHDACQELKRMLHLLDHGACRVETLEQSVEQRERELEKRRQLNEAAQALINNIRGYPGFHRFLLPPAFDALLDSFPEGYIVIVNASRLGHDALLLHRARGLATSLALRPFRADIDCAGLRSQLPRDMMALSSQKLETKIRAMRLDSGRVGNLEDILTLLWTHIGLPVIEAMGIHEAQGRARPRLWWCVTGELSFLPIHAAGKHRGTSQACTGDYVVSSYIPTLASLTKARKEWKPMLSRDLVGLLICEASTIECSTASLPHAVDEVIAIRECFAAAGAQVLNHPSDHFAVSELRSMLQNTPTHVLHMACHGIQDSDPLKSSFLLHDGRLSIEDIIQLNIPYAFLAFLSACQTAKGDRNAPDQAVHLAASMLFSGFRSIVGTMWSMCDEDGPKVAEHFYGRLFAKEEVDLDDIAYALDEAIQALRQSGVPASRWAPFMHIGG